MGAQYLADGARADPVAEAAQLALDPDHAPAGVVPGQLDDQLGQRAGQRRASRGPGLGPFLRDHAAVPAQQRSRADDPARPQRPGQDPGQRGEHRPIRPVHPRPWVAAAQHRHLVTQDQDLGVLRRRRPSRQRKPQQQRGQGAIDQANQHDHPSSQVTLIAEFREYYRQSSGLHPVTAGIDDPGDGGLVRCPVRSHLKHAIIVARAPASRSQFAGPGMPKARSGPTDQAPPAGITKRVDISYGIRIAGITLRRPRCLYLCDDARGLSRPRLRRLRPRWSRPVHIDVCSMFARTPRYTPAAPGIRSATPMSAGGLNGSSQHVLALSDSSSRRINEQTADS